MHYVNNITKFINENVEAGQCGFHAYENKRWCYDQFLPIYFSLHPGHVKQYIKLGFWSAVIWSLEERNIANLLVVSKIMTWNENDLKVNDVLLNEISLL